MITFSRGAMYFTIMKQVYETGMRKYHASFVIIALIIEPLKIVRFHFGCVAEDTFYNICSKHEFFISKARMYICARILSQFLTLLCINHRHISVKKVQTSSLCNKAATDGRGCRKILKAEKGRM